MSEIKLNHSKGVKIKLDDRISTAITVRYLAMKIF